MKRLLQLAVASSLLIAGCRNAEEIDYPKQEGDGVSTEIPQGFSQKTMIEEFTGAWCGYCPVGAIYLEDNIDMNPNKIFGVAVHVGDIMECAEAVDPNTGANMIDNIFNDYGYPGGVAMRTTLGGQDLAPNNWEAKITARLGGVPRCGLAIDATKLEGNNLELKVHTGFAEDLQGAYRLHVYLVQDYIQTTDANYDQHNYLSSQGSDPDTSSPLYNLPPTINNYRHNNVLRKVLTALPDGYVIPSTDMVKGQQHIATFTADLTGLTPSRLFVVAFVDKYGTSAQGHRIENVQRVRVGELQNWD